MMASVLRRVFTLLLAAANFLGFGLRLEPVRAAANGTALAYPVGDGVYLLDDYGVSSAYLIVGSEKCLVIDAGIGFADFRERVEEYSQGKPVICALTHGHVDHAGAAKQFEEVYVHKDEAEIRYQQSLAVRFLYTLIGLTHVISRYGVSAFDVSDRNNVESETIYIEDGYAFDLGGRKVTFVHTPGHTKGSGCFTDSKTNILFAGDSTHTSVMLIFPESLTVETYNRSIKKIGELEQTASAVCNGHSKSPQDKAVTQELIAVTDELLRSTESNTFLYFIMKKNSTAVLPDGAQKDITLRYVTSKVFD